MKHAIVVNNVHKAFKLRGNTKLISGLFRPDWQYKDAVQDVSFSIQPGESVAFLGPNGAGKTTTTKMLTGLTYPTKGNIEVLGYIPFNRDYDFLKRIGLVMGNKAGLNWDLTALQSFELTAQIYGIPDTSFKNQLNELSDLLKIDHALKTQVRKLSLGERMKLELVNAILHDPDILFLDEPTIGLDIDAKKSVRKFLRHIHASGKTLLLTSHDMDDITEVCDRVIIINHGRIVYDDSMKSLTKHYGHTRYARMEFMGKSPDKATADRMGDLVHHDDTTLTIGAPKDKIMEIANKLSKHGQLVDITIEQVPLEVVISDLFQKSDNKY